MKASLFPRITHAVVTTAKNKEQAIRIGVEGSIRLCFGPSDDDCIAQIHFLRDKRGQISWRLPHVQVNESKHLPVFMGKAYEEISQRALEVYNSIKANLGGVSYDKKYRVAGSKVTVIEEEKKAAS